MVCLAAESSSREKFDWLKSGTDGNSDRQKGKPTGSKADPHGKTDGPACADGKLVNDQHPQNQHDQSN